MNKPDFTKLSREELRKYIIANRTDDEAIRELFVNRRNPNAVSYPAPLTPETLKITEEAIRNKLIEIRTNHLQNRERLNNE